MKDNINTAETPIQEALDEKGPMWRRLLGYTVKYLVPLALTILLVWYMFTKIDVEEMLSIIRHGVNYWWILLAMGISVLSHIVRAARWRIQLITLGIRPPFMALCCSIFGTYALNLVFPRLGEVWRCAYISRRQQAPFATVLGSMVADRLSDTIMVLCITIFTFIVARSGMTAFLTKYPIGADLISAISNPATWVAAILAIAAIWGILHFGRNNRIIRKLTDTLTSLWQGFASVARMKGKWAFLGYTLAIWGCYFMQLYVAFYAFSFTDALCHTSGLAFGLLPCLVAFVLSSIGMAVPSNGGLGPWNVAVMFGLAIYGISDTQGSAFSILVWSAQTIMLVLLGIYTMVYISIGKRHTTNTPLK